MLPFGSEREVSRDFGRKRMAVCMYERARVRREYGVRILDGWRMMMMMLCVLN